MIQEEYIYGEFTYNEDLETENKTAKKMVIPKVEEFTPLKIYQRYLR